MPRLDRLLNQLTNANFVLFDQVAILFGDVVTTPIFEMFGVLSRVDVPKEVLNVG